LAEGSDEEKIRTKKMEWLRGRMTQNKNRNFQVGDSVKVKNGTKDPDFGIDIGGWQGQISEIDNDLISPSVILMF